MIHPRSIYVYPRTSSSENPEANHYDGVWIDIYDVYIWTIILSSSHNLYAPVYFMRWSIGG